MIYPRRVGREALVSREVRAADDFAHPGILGLVAYRHDYMTVARAEHLVGNDIGMGIPEPLRRDAGDEIVHRLVGKHGDLRIEQREVDVLARSGAITMSQRAENPDRRVEAGKHVGHRYPDLHRTPSGTMVRLARDAHQATDALDS